LTHIAREIGLLRSLAENLVSKPLPVDPITEDFLRAEGLHRAMRQTSGIVAIREPGREAFTELSESIIGQHPAMERGTFFTNFQTELFDALATGYIGRDPSSIGAADVSALHDHLSGWFANSASPRTIFVPCAVSPWPAPRFAIGPVVFVFVEEVVQSEFYPPGSSDFFSRDGFDRMLQLMRDTRANWLACVPVEGCERSRAEEVGALAADLAIVAFQLAVPAFGTRSMSRLDARRGVPNKQTLSGANGSYNTCWTTNEPGLVIGPGTLTHILEEAQTLMDAVGSCVRSFTTGRYRFPTLERFTL
jgi:hypothetical protein